MQITHKSINPRSVEDPFPIYQIKVQGILPPEWIEWFEGMQMETDADNNTLLIGPVHDQAALHGLLARVRDLGMVLLALWRYGEKHCIDK